MRTIDSRGNGSTVSLTHGARSGWRERRLYGGLCWAIRRSSRTCASSVVAQTIGVTDVASWTISAIRVRVSDAVK